MRKLKEVPVSTEYVLIRSIVQDECPNHCKKDFPTGDKVFRFTGDTRGVIGPGKIPVVEIPQMARGGPFYILPKDALDDATVTDHGLKHDPGSR